MGRETTIKARREIMITRLVATALFLTASAASFALDIKPYSAQALSAEQQAGKPVTLHFHADWCPTCRAQEKVFQQWTGDASVPGRRAARRAC